MFPRSWKSFDLGLPGGKPLRGESVRVLGKFVFVLLLGLVFGYILQSASLLVRAVDSFSRSGSSGVFTSYGQGVSYGE